MTVTGLAVTAEPGRLHRSSGARRPSAAGSSDRPGATSAAPTAASGAAGTWSGRRDGRRPARSTCPAAHFDCFDVATGPAAPRSRSGGRAAPSGDQIAAALRSGPGGAWGGPETAGGSGTAATPRRSRRSPPPGPGRRLELELRQHARRRTAPTATAPAPGIRSTLGLVQDDSVYLGGIAAGRRRQRARPPSRTATASPRPASTAPGRASARSRCRPARQGEAAPFSAAADDNWSGPAADLVAVRRRRDGRTARPSATPTAAGGTFTATATATDAVGNASARSGPRQRRACRRHRRPTPDPCGTGDRDKDGIKDTLRHQRRLQPPRGVQDRQREGRLRRGLRQAAGRRRARRGHEAAQGLRPARGRPDDPGRLDARHRQGPGLAADRVRHAQARPDRRVLPRPLPSSARSASRAARPRSARPS